MKDTAILARALLSVRDSTRSLLRQMPECRPYNNPIVTRLEYRRNLVAQSRQ